MKYVTVVFCLTDDLLLKEIVIDSNDTELPSDSDLLKKLSCATLKSLHLNKDSVMVQDLLNELDIKPALAGSGE